MRYLSPMRLYTYCNVDINDPNATTLPQVKQLVDTKLATTSDNTITVDGCNYSKNAILQDFETADWDKNLKYHLLIWNTPGLLNLLENNAVNFFKARKEWFNLSEDKEFVDFVSPYFTESFNYVMACYLNPADFNNARSWMLFLVFVSETYQDKALASTRNFLDESIKLFQDTNAYNYQTNFIQIEPWGKQQWHFLMNDLPASLFEYKEKTAKELQKMTLAIQSVDVDITYMISTRLSQQEGLSYDLGAIIKGNHELFSQAHTASINQFSDEVEAEEESSPIKVIISVVLFIIAIVKFIFELAN